MAQLAGKDDDDIAGASGGQGSNGEMAGKHGDAPSKSPPSATPIDAVSIALRHAYESTVDEPIPDTFMDLLNKLG